MYAKVGGVRLTVVTSPRMGLAVEARDSLLADVICSMLATSFSAVVTSAGEYQFIASLRLR